MDVNIELPENVKYIISQLNQRGFAAYAVGGCVRDSIMGRKPHDWDVCTSALPEQMQDIFSGKKLVLAGVKHGTVGIIMSGEVYEATTFRVEGEYRDHRHPESVRFVREVEGDLSRRDFTVNAMAYSEESGLIDLFGGAADIKAGIIRCVGDPYKRFREDALRMLRALRFAAVFGFLIHEDTKKAVIELCGLLGDISQERKTAELRGMLKAEKPGALIREYSRVFEQVLGVPAEHIEKRALTVDAAPPDFALRIGILAAERAALERMKLSNAELAVAYAAAENMDRQPPQTLPQMRRMVWQLGSFTGPALDAMSAANDVSRAHELLNEIEQRGLCCSVAQLDINGRELAAIGFKGVQIGKTLEALLLEVMDESLQNDKRSLKARAIQMKKTRASV